MKTFLQNVNHTDGQYSKCLITMINVWKPWNTLTHSERNDKRPAGWSEWLVISCHARGALAQVLGTSQLRKSINWPTASAVQNLLRPSFCCETHHHSFQPRLRVENGLLFVYYRRNCSHPFQLLYTDTWSWLINSYRSCTLHLISDTRWPWIIVMNSITPENWGLCTVQGKEYWKMSTLLQVICRDGHSDFFGIRIGIYAHIQFSKKSYSECSSPVICLYVSFWTWGPKYIFRTHPKEEW